MNVGRKAADALYRNNFGAFTYAGFTALNPGMRLVPNWHIDAVCHHVQEMVLGRGRKRLVLNSPPRTLKSFKTSVSLPAWILGRNPGARIICASYSEDLAHKFSRDTRTLLETPFYRRIFPRTRLKRSERKLEPPPGASMASSNGHVRWRKKAM